MRWPCAIFSASLSPKSLEQCFSHVRNLPASSGTSLFRKSDDHALAWTFALQNRHSIPSDPATPPCRSGLGFPRHGSFQRVICPCPWELLPTSPNHAPVFIRLKTAGYGWVHVPKPETRSSWSTAPRSPFSIFEKATFPEACGNSICTARPSTPTRSLRMGPVRCHNPPFFYI